MMQSVNLSFARYMFYKNKDINIDMSNYRLLFINQKEFIKKYGINNKELLDLYNYLEYKDRNKDRKLVLDK